MAVADVPLEEDRPQKSARPGMAIQAVFDGFSLNTRKGTSNDAAMRSALAQAHQPGCSLAPKGKGKRKGKAKGPEAAPKTGIGMADLRAMSPTELMKLRDRIVKVLADKVGDIDAEIKELQELKKSVAALTGK